MTETHIKQGKPLSPFAQRLLHASSIAGAIATVIFCIWAYQKGLFTSQEALSEYMQRAGIWGPPVFILLQILQTVIPIIPGVIKNSSSLF